MQVWLAGFHEDPSRMNVCISHKPASGMNFPVLQNCSAYLDSVNTTKITTFRIDFVHSIQKLETIVPRGYAFQVRSHHSGAVLACQ